MQKKIASLCREKLFCFKWGRLHPKKKVRSPSYGGSYFALSGMTFRPKKIPFPVVRGRYYKTSFKQAKPIPLLPFTKIQKFCTAVCCSSATTCSTFSNDLNSF